MPPTTTRRPRRSQSQWQTLIEAQQASGQSATDYCETHDIGYVSFCKWRKRLSQPVACGVTDQQHGSNFIDLASLEEKQAGWHIVLRLGGGVEIALTRS